MRPFPQILAAALAAAAIASPAAAQTPASVSVRYTDLDLSSRAGQAQLERRIDKAARSVCRMDEVTVGTRLRSTEGRLCYEETKARVHAQVAEMIARDNSRG